MNWFIQATTPRPGPFDRWILGWAWMGISVMKAHGYHATILHDEIIFTRTAK